MTATKSSKIQFSRQLRLYYKKMTERASHPKKKKTMWQPTNPIENYTLWLLIFSAILALISGVQMYLIKQSNKEAAKASSAAISSANAAMESNDISRKMLIAEQRPWIKVEVGIGGSLSYTDKGWDAGFRWHFPLEYSLINIGKTPGTNVSFHAQMMPYTLPHWRKEDIVDGVPQGQPIPGTDIAKELETICGFPENMTSVNMGFGQTVFPNDNIQSIFNVNGDPKRFEQAKSNEANTKQFLLVVCVSYGSTLDKEMYRTARAYQLLRKDSGFEINLDGETILAKDLALVPTPQQIGSVVK